MEQDQYDERDALVAINAKLLKSRGELGLDAEGRGALGIGPVLSVGEVPAILAPPPRPGDRSRGNVAAVAISAELVSLPKKGRYPCAGTLADRRRPSNCTTMIAFPGRCPRCYAAVDAADLAVKVRDRLRRIPGEYRSSTWDELEAGLPSRAGGERVKVDRQRLRRIRARLSELQDGDRVVLVGPPGWGKSTIAGAWLRAVIEGGEESAFWVPADELDLDALPDDGEKTTVLPREAARRGRFVVLDDLGGETANAPTGGGLLAMRIAHAVKVIVARHSRNSGVLLITSNYNEAKFAERYEERIKRRIFEGAITIDLETA